MEREPPQQQAQPDLAEAEGVLRQAADVPIPEENDDFVLAAEAKGTKELNSKIFSKEEHRALDGSDGKELAAWRDKEAFEELSKKEMAEVLKEKRDRVIPGRARAVRTNKSVL